MHLEYKFETKAIQDKFKKLKALGKSEGLTRKIANVLSNIQKLGIDIYHIIQ